MSYETILLEQKEPGIWLLTVNRPKALNALAPQVLYDIASAVAKVNGDAAARALMITGAGEKAFVAGADIAAMSGMTPIEGRAFALEGHATSASRSKLSPFPGDRARSTGSRSAAAASSPSRATSSSPPRTPCSASPRSTWASCPGFGGTQRLARLVGKGIALELVCTGRQVKADEALRIGLANHVVAPEMLLEQGLKLARMVAAKGPVAVKMAKHLVQRGQDLDLANANAMEADVFGFVFASDDRREGMAAFLAKRPAQFTGK